MPSSDHVKADAGARRVEEPLHGQIRLYNVKSAEVGKLFKYFFKIILSKYINKIEYYKICGEDMDVKCTKIR